jgi:hypothetical protein
MLTLFVANSGVALFGAGMLFQMTQQGDCFSADEETGRSNRAAMWKAKYGDGGSIEDLHQ